MAPPLRFSRFLRSTFLLLAVSTALVATSACNPVVDPGQPTACAPDAFEDNDTEGMAIDLRSMQDDPNSQQDLGGLTTHMTGDEDWYRVHVRDTGLGGDPVVTASVSSDDFEVTTYFVCDSGSSWTQCTYGSEGYRTSIGFESTTACNGSPLGPMTDSRGVTIMDNGASVSSTTDCSGTSSDDGTLYIRVRRAAPTYATGGVCSYALSVYVE